MATILSMKLLAGSQLYREQIPTLGDRIEMVALLILTPALQTSWLPPLKMGLGPPPDVMSKLFLLRMFFIGCLVDCALSLCRGSFFLCSLHFLLQCPRGTRRRAYLEKTSKLYSVYRSNQHGSRMCYSTTVSFSSAVVLAVGGVICLRKAECLDQLNGVFPLLPLLFGIQQSIEGLVWWALGANDPEVLRLSALGFLSFSHVIWPICIPFSCYLTEPRHQQKSLFLLLTILGTLFGLTTFTPLLLNTDWLVVFERHHSIVYQTTLIYDGVLPRPAVTLAYTLVVLLPLLLSVRLAYRFLGLLMLLAAMLTAAMFKLTFISVWCFFAALISLYIYYIVVVQAEAEIGSTL